MNGFTPQMLFRWLVIIIILSVVSSFLGLKGLIIITIALGIYLYLPTIKRKMKNRNYQHSYRDDRDIDL